MVTHLVKRATERIHIAVGSTAPFHLQKKRAKTITKKDDLRKKILDLRNKVPLSDHQRWSALIQDNILSILSGCDKHLSLCFYWPIKSEVDIKPLFELLRQQNYRLLLPSISQEDTLKFKEFTSNDQLIDGAYSIKEPVAEAKIMDPDIIFVPLVAFDKYCYRLGYGKGYYDKAIAALKNRKSFYTIGVAFSNQEVDSIPHENWDQKLDVVITEKEDLVVY